MIFGKHINKYYLKYLPMLLLGAGALLLVDYMQLFIPEIYSSVIRSINENTLILDFLLNDICAPMLIVILCMVFGRFLWRVCFFGAGVKLETDLRGRMFDRCKDLSQQYYQVNKVGNLMSLFTNDLDTIQ